MVAVFVILAFLGTFTVAAVAALVANAVLEKRVQSSGGIVTASGAGLLKAEVLSSISLWQSLLARFDFVDTMKKRLQEAGMNWTVGRLTLQMLLAGSIVLGLMMNVTWVPGWAALLAGGLAGSLPYLAVLRKRGRRFRKFQEQFPEALDYLSRSMAAGHPFATALEMLASENLAPVSAEFRRAADERKLGSSWEDAFRNMIRRVPLVEVSVFAAAVQLHSRAGGKLNEVLGRLAETMRESVALEGEVRSIAAHGKLTGAVLSMLPLFIVSIMTTVNPGYFLSLLRHPFGKDLIAAALAALVLAHVAIRRIVDIRI